MLCVIDLVLLSSYAKVGGSSVLAGLFIMEFVRTLWDVMEEMDPLLITVFEGELQFPLELMTEFSNAVNVERVKEVAKVEQLTAAFRTGSTQDLVDSWVKAAKAAENSGNVRGCFWAELIAPQKKSVYQAGLVVGGLSDTEHATVVDTTLYFEIDGRLFMFGDDGKIHRGRPWSFPNKWRGDQGPREAAGSCPGWIEHSRSFTRTKSPCVDVKVCKSVESRSYQIV